MYVHAKIGVVNDEWLSIGSANLNEHSLFNDTELNFVADDAGLARSVRERLWSEHLDEDCRGADPLAVQLRRLPSTSRRSARLLGPVKGLIVDG